MAGYSTSDDSITKDLDIIGAPDIRVSLLMRELRREHTGLHGLVAIAEGGRVLAHDTFNVGRSEERRKLAKAAHGMMPRATQELLPLDGLILRLDELCLYAMTGWETDRVSIEVVSTRTAPTPRTMLLFPHVELGASTIFFGEPGVGKSWLMALMAVSLTVGVQTVWGSQRQTPCLYVDLERNQMAFHRRLSQIGKVLGQDIDIPYLRGKGMGLSSLRRKLRSWVSDNPGGILLYDSISRMGGGSLNDDTTANGVVDMANGLSETWAALGHSPRADAGHIFGSQLWDAGADMMVKMSSEHRGSRLGCALTVTKANHAGVIPVSVFSLEFDDTGLIGLSRSTIADWPELGANLPSLLYALLDGQEMSVKNLSDMTKTPPSTVTYNLKKDIRLEYHEVGRETLWRRKTNAANRL